MKSDATGVELLRLNEALEQQAREIGQALHDDCGQLLASVYLALESISQTAPLAVRERIQEVTHLLDQVEQEVRQFSHRLCPTGLDGQGLAIALQELARRVASRGDLSVKVDFPNPRPLPRPIDVALYRIAEEALTNVLRHAKATHVRIRLRVTSSKLHCVISDDGIGFPVASAARRRGSQGLGLCGMRARVEALGGKFAMRSVIGRGTTLILTIPFR